MSLDVPRPEGYRKAWDGQFVRRLITERSEARSLLWRVLSDEDIAHLALEIRDYLDRTEWQQP